MYRLIVAGKLPLASKLPQRRYLMPQSLMSCANCIKEQMLRINAFKKTLKGQIMVLC
jgi:hypothetical protein